MDCLRDHNIERRQAWLRALQGLPGTVPAGYTVVRKSDFARPRRTILICLAVVVAAIAYAANLPTYDAQQPSAERATSLRRTLCDLDCRRITRPIRRFT